VLGGAPGPHVACRSRPSPTVFWTTLIDDAAPGPASLQPTATP